MQLNDLDPLQNISTDTRSIKPGDVYVALKGDNYDGHDYISEAIAKGAKAIVTARRIGCSIPTILVCDTLQALGELAKRRRQYLATSIVALTGSCGKTTTKNMLAAILAEAGETLATAKNNNNTIGVPLTLLQLEAKHQYAVIEMGTDHPGEINFSARVASPDVALVTNVSASHLAGFEGLAEIAQEKGQVYQNLSEAGTAIINADDSYAEYWQGLVIDKRTVTFGLTNAADVSAENINYDHDGLISFSLVTAAGSVEIELPLLGQHNVYNALAAAAVAIALTIPLDMIQCGLSKMQPEANRLSRYRGLAGEIILDDSYNANPASTKAALEVLARMSGEKVLIFADMLELGAEAVAFHQQIGIMARDLGIDRVYTYGDLAANTAASFGDNGVSFTTQAALIQHLQQILHKQMVLLVKGSHAMKMEQIVAALI